MEEKKEIYHLGDSGFWSAWFSKLFFTIISVKVWGLVACTWISTSLLLNENVQLLGEEIKFGITGGQWITFNTTIWALIFGMKEVFRISDKRDKTEKATINSQLETKVKMAAIAGTASISQRATSIQADGTETVGDEPS